MRARCGLIWMLAVPLASAGAGIAPSSLRVEMREVDSAGVQRISLRRFEDGSGMRWRLLLDPRTLETKLGRAADWAPTSCPLSVFDGTRWGQLRKAQREKGWRTGGVVCASLPGAGVILSVDLCPAPSYRPFDRRLLKGLSAAFGPQRKPVPVAFAVSGDWLRRHPADFRWLEDLARQGQIAPTWVNHSDTHRFAKGKSARRNFMKLPGTDVEAEVLGAEVEMLRRGLLPSVFFRFPGLVDDSSLSEKVLRTGLIPIGSDAWLAKSQRPSAGSIVLVHGNGNEPAGVREFLRLLGRERRSIREGRWRVMDLTQGLGSGEGKAFP